MVKPSVIISKLLLVILFCLSHVVAHAEDAVFSEAELDQMMAPIALYPDSLLAQILMASTYPADVADAVKWSKDNPKQEGDAAVKAVQSKSWDPSVMALVAFPQVLAMAGDKPDWVQGVGDAFLADSDQVMDTVQKLRKKAKDAGNLETTKQQKVVVEQPSSTETIIIIEPVNPQIVYVPAYNPVVIYGVWWWPHYTPYYYRPVGYGFGSAVVAGIGFGIGVGITNSLWGNCNWGHGDIDIDINRHNNININSNKIDASRKNTSWNHNSNNRRGVPYKDKGSRQKFNTKRDGADQRESFRGRDTQRDKARTTLNQRAVDPAKGRTELQGRSGDQVRKSLDNANRTGGLGSNTRDTGGARNKAADRGLSTRSTASRDSALRGSGNARQSRQNISRGNTSRGSMRSFGGGHSGGLGGGHRR